MKISKISVLAVFGLLVMTVLVSTVSAQTAWWVGGNTFGGSGSTQVLGTTTADNLGFITNNVQHMVITTTGEVGIGLASPSHKLEISDSSSTANRAGLYVTQSGSMTGNTGYGIYVRKTGTSLEHIGGYFEATGAQENFGIETYCAYTSATLNVGGDFIAQGATNNNYGIRASGSGTGATNYGGVFTSSGAATTNIGGYFSAISATNNYGIIVENGDVGIGTTTPVEKLDVNGGVKIGNTANTNAGTVRWSGSDFEGHDGSNWVSLTTSVDHDWYDPSSGAPPTSINSDVYTNGKVGIGINPPVAGLDVQTGVTAPSTGSPGVARGANFEQRLTAGNNNDIITGARIKPTFVDSDYTSVYHLGLDVDMTSSVASSVFDEYARVGDSATHQIAVGLGIYHDSTPTSHPAIQAMNLANLPEYGQVLHINPEGSHTILNLESGNVGIGIGSPANKLDVAGAVAVGSSYAGTGAPSNGAIIQGTVGIGTSGPGSKLEIMGTGTSQASSSLHVTDSSSNSLFFVRDDGLIGIGTSAPNFNLDINGDCKIKDDLEVCENSNTGIRFLSNPSITSAWDDMLIKLNDDGYDTDAKFEIQQGSSPSNPDLRFLFGSSGNFDSYIMPRGDLGINIRDPATKLHINGDVAFGEGSELTIASDTVTVTHSYHTIEIESGTTDDLSIINGGNVAGQILVISAADSAHTVVVKDDTGPGNLKLSGDFSLTNIEDSLVLIYDGSDWLELSRSNNGV